MTIPQEPQVKEKQTEKYAVLFGGLFVLCYTIACSYLYYMQATHIGGQYFESDLPYHIKMAVEDQWGYSLTAIIYRLFSHLPNMYIAVAVFLAVCTSATLVVTYFGIFRQVAKPWLALAFTVISGFVMPIFIEAVHYQRYIGYQSPSIWHNSTYIVMKLLAVLTCVWYIKRVKSSGEGLNPTNWIIMSLLLAVTTATKTSFVIVFAPALLVMLLADLCRGESFKKLFFLGLTMLPSLAVILIQNAILFGDQNGIEIRFGYTLYMHTGNAPYTMILSAFFPVLVFIANIVPFSKQLFLDCKSIHAYRRMPKAERKSAKLPVFQNRLFWGAWLMWFFGALEIMFLCETGTRALDANFAWGYYFALFVVFIISMCVWVDNMNSRSYPAKLAWVKYVYGVMTGAVLLWHGYCGILFYIKLLCGTTYFM